MLLQEPFFLFFFNLTTGIIIGSVFYRADYCMAGMFRDVFLFRDYSLLRSLLLLIIAAMSLFYIARLSGLSRFLVIMELYGHDTSKLKLLDGGIKAWQAKGYQVTAEATLVSKKAEYKTSGPNENMLISWSSVLKDSVLGQDTTVVLHDARPVDEFSGNKIRAIRGGHIPGAINVTGVSAANNKDEQTYKSPAEIKKAFEDAGITPDKTVYTYCHSGDRAAHAYVVLKHILGYKNVKIYDGSWNEWATLTALPAEEEKWIAAQSVLK